MEFNREEAMNAKNIAETKMQTNDFIGAQEIALRVQQLFPDLENISQILTVCEVQCSAQNKLYGSEMDWYKVLGVDKVADEETIKKQYRKLAFLLHPDKNKFPGAESAFKIIGEANMVLSDREKRASYDMKCAGPVRTFATPKAPQYQNVVFKKSMGSKPHQKSQSTSNNGQETFWTSCSGCNTRYQYYREIIGKTLICHNCKKTYAAHEIGPRGLSSVWNPKPPVYTDQKDVPKPNFSQMGSRIRTKVVCGLFARKPTMENRAKKRISKESDGKSFRNTGTKRDRMFMEKTNGSSSSTSTVKDDVSSFSHSGENLPNRKIEVLDDSDDDDVKDDKAENRFHGVDQAWAKSKEKFAKRAHRRYRS